MGIPIGNPMGIPMENPYGPIWARARALPNGVGTGPGPGPFPMDGKPPQKTRFGKMLCYYIYYTMLYYAILYTIYIYIYIYIIYIYIHKASCFMHRGVLGPLFVNLVPH